MKISLYALGLVLISFPLWAQLDYIGLDPTYKITQYNLNKWGTREGLPSDSVLCVHQSQNGYLWIGTFTGLVRYNGFTFTILNKANTPGLIDNNIWKIFETRDGTMYLCTYDGVVVYKNGIFTPFEWNNKLPSRNIKEILEDQDHRFWIATVRGLAIYDQTNLYTPPLAPYLENCEITSMVQDKQNTLWVGTIGQGLIRIKDYVPQQFTEKDGLLSNTVTSLMVDHNNRLWIGFKDGLLLRHHDEWIPINPQEGLVSNFIKTLYEDRSGAIWVGTDKGINRYFNKKWESFDQHKSLESMEITHFFQDKEGNLWVGTYRDGVFQLSSGKMHSFSKDEGLSHNIVNCVYEVSPSTLFLGTDDGLDILENRRIRPHPLSEKLPNRRIRDILIDSQENLWLCTNQGVVQAQKGIKKVFDEKTGLSNDLTRIVHEDKDGAIWVGTNAGLNRYSKGNWVIYGIDQGLPDTMILSLLEDVQGNIWVGTRAGLGRIQKPMSPSQDPYGVVEAFSDPHLDLSDVIFQIFQDATDTIWIGCKDGILRYKDGAFAKAPSSKEFTFSDIYQLYEDGSGNFWMTNTNGILRVRIPELDAFISGTMESIPITAFGLTDGMKSAHCTPNASGIKDSDGILWFPTVHGVVMTDPLKQPINRLVPPVYIENVTVNMKSVEFKDTVTLASASQRINFEFTALSYVVPVRLTFKYRLQGFDNEWIDAGTNRFANYTSLPHGDYVFQVKAANSDGIWNEEGASLKISIQPTFVETVWFQILIGILVVMLIVFFYWVRMRQINYQRKRMQKILVRQTADLADEKEKANSLLGNILPEEIAVELKKNGVVKAKRYEETSIMFTDFQGFTDITSILPAHMLINELNEIFIQFDEITESYDIEKIKTIGDAYLAVAGIPKMVDHHAMRCVMAAYEMLDFIEKRNHQSAIKWLMRVGIHSGSIIAGVVGKRKFSFDIWGDSVNIASRMERYGEPGRINISAFTFHLIHKEIPCEYRGKIDVKGKGNLDMYFTNPIEKINDFDGIRQSLKITKKDFSPAIIPPLGNLL